MFKCSKYFTSFNLRAREKKMRILTERKFKVQIETEERLEKKKNSESEKKVQEWQRIKQIEAEDKMSRLLELKKELEQRFDSSVAKEKPEEIKKGISFQDWLKKKKNVELIALKKNLKNQQRKTTSYAKFDNSNCGIQTEPSKSKALNQPDPLKGGVNSFWGNSIVVKSCGIGK